MISILIASYNTRTLLERCLDSIQDCMDDLALEVIVVDNASRDGSAKMVAKNYPWVRLIRNHTNLYFAHATNQALELSTGEKVLLLNSDIELPPGALSKLLRQQPKDVVGVVPLVRGLDGRPQPEYIFRELPTAIELVLNLMFFRRIARALRMTTRWEKGRIAIDRDMDVEQPGASCLVLDSAVARGLGGLDERLPLWFNDVDLCKRIAQAGYRLRYLHDVSVVHVGGASISNLPEADRAERLYADTLSYALKWHRGSLLLIKLAMCLNLLVRCVLIFRKPREVVPWFRSLPRIVKTLLRGHGA